MIVFVSDLIEEEGKSLNGLLFRAAVEVQQSGFLHYTLRDWFWFG